MPKLHVSRDWWESFTRGDVIETPDRYQLATSYDHNGQRWTVLHRIDRPNWTVVVDHEAFQTEWVAL